MLAAREGNTKKVEFLLNHHANIEAKSHYNNTALLCACDGSYSKVVELLLKRGANKEACNNTDYTPLCLAASRGRCSCCLMAQKLTLVPAPQAALNLSC